MAADPAPDRPSTSDPSAEPEVDPGRGLTRAEAAAQLAEFGPNEVPEPKGNPWLAFLGKFWGLSAWMLELILVLSAFLGKFADLAVAGVLLVVNAVLRFLQERRSAKVVEALKERLLVTARVLRDGAWQLIPARELVPGDLVRVRPGDIIPADLKLLSGDIQVDQSALTGESEAIRRSAGDTLFAGAVARRGEANGVVVMTGARTYFGRTTELVQLARPKLHIEAVVGKVIRWLFAIVAALLGLVVGLSLVRGDPLLEVAPLLLVLLMSALPVALPVMFTVSLAVGAKELSTRGVLVTRLSAVEDAATMVALCVDKTGTVTMNQLVVTGVVPVGAATESAVLAAAALASQEANQDPLDLALLGAARERRVLDQTPPWAPVSFAPFDPANRRTEAVVERNGQRMRVVKGALRAVTEACGLEPRAIEALEAQHAGSARGGSRVLAVASGPAQAGLELLGMVILQDPPRPDAGRLIAELRALGVDVKMLTGDALPVASGIAQDLGLNPIRRMADLKRGEPDDGGTGGDPWAGAGGFAELFPEDKYLVVKHLQACGQVVGMTGDGVNDAPALRQAEVGIAVSSATDVAKASASVVLTEPGLANIVSLVQQGRSIYQRVLTWILNKISRTILKGGFFTIAYAVTGRFVISAFAMLMLTLVTDFGKISLATDHVRPSRSPETWKIGGTITMAVAVGLAMVAEALLFLAFGWSRFGLRADPRACSTFCFLMLLYFAPGSILSLRERRGFWASRPSFPLLAALAAEWLIGTSLTRFALPGFVRLPWKEILVLFAYAMVTCLVLNDGLKRVLLKLNRRNAG
jgi:plasma-membrane proton-efflux P-type ATPase